MLQKKRIFFQEKIFLQERNFYIAKQNHIDLIMIEIVVYICMSAEFDLKFIGFYLKSCKSIEEKFHFDVKIKFNFERIFLQTMFVFLKNVSVIYVIININKTNKLA